MSAPGRFAAAVKSVGGTAYLREKDGDKAFPASIQPAFHGTARSGSALGVGDTDRYDMYTGCGEDAMRIKRGGRILFQGREYDVRRIETMWLKGEAVYRKARLQAGNETEAG